MREDSLKKFKLKINYFYQKIFGEKNLGDIGFDFSTKPSRNEIVQSLINIKNYKNYLEIGCDNNELFDFIKCEKKIGIDPEKGGNLRINSDDFFLTNKINFDIIFIDGLHEFDQVCKDIDNSIKCLNNEGIILIHDCLPNNVYQQIIPRCKATWNGDVWKAIVKYRTKKNIDVYTCYADQGIGVILKRPNKNHLMIEVNDFKHLKFIDFYKNYNKYMNLVEYKDLIKII